MEISTYDVTIRGIRPLIMHNGRLANPIDPHSKALKSLTNKYKTSKSDADFEAVCKAEYMGALYYDKDLGPYIPVDNIQAVLVEGARKRRLGTKFEALVTVIEPDTAGYKLIYDGPRDVEELYANPTYVFTKLARVNQARVMRTRPRFPSKWEVSFGIEVMEGGPDKDQIEEAVHDAGFLRGLGDWLPRYGRFQLISFNKTN